MTMMKRILRPAAVLAAAAALATGAYAAELVPVGETVGIEVRTEGMLVAGLTGVETGSGEVCPAAGQRHTARGRDSAPGLTRRYPPARTSPARRRSWTAATCPSPSSAGAS